MTSQNSTWLVVIVTVLAMLANGCASSMTSCAPRLTTVQEGETFTSGTQALRFDASLTMDRKHLMVTQTAICREMVSRESVSRKKLHGVFPAVIEIGFFGLGILDLVMANSIVKESEVRTPLEAIPTGNMLPCGNIQPAAYQQVILQFSDSDALVYALTDENGMINPETALTMDRKRTAYVNVFVRTGSAKRFAGPIWLRSIP